MHHSQAFIDLAGNDSGHEWLLQLARAINEEVASKYSIESETVLCSSLALHTCCVKEISILKTNE